MIRRLKIKFVFVNMLIVTLILASIFGMVLCVTNHNMQAQGERQIDSILDEHTPGNREWRYRKGPYFVAAVTPQGSITIIDREQLEEYSDEQLRQIARETWTRGRERGMLKGENLIYGRREEPANLRIAFVDITAERRIMEGLIKTCGSIAAASFLLFLGISILLAQWAVRPVEEAWKQQQQFVADASHELKTPLTVIMTNAELIKNQKEGEEGVSFADNILMMSRQMRGLVEGLLNLARVDNGSMKTSFTELDLSELMENAVLPFEPVFFEKNMVLESKLQPQIRMRGSDSHLKQLMDILLDNAAKYASPDSTVTVHLERQGVFAVLCVSNPCQQVSPGDLKRIFKRFYRIDKARSMNGSYGLGLSIAEKIVHDHGGKIRAEWKNGQIHFMVLLPVQLT